MYTGWCPFAKHVPLHGTHRLTFQKIDEFPQMQFLDKLMTSVVIQRLVPGRDSTDNREVPVEIPQVQFLNMPSTRWSMSLLCCAVGFRRCTSSTVVRPCDHAEMLCSSVQDDLSAPPLRPAPHLVD